MSDENEIEDTGNNTSGAAASPAAVVVRLSDAQWAEIREKWEFGTHNLAQLSAEYGTTKSNLSQYFKRHGIQKGSREQEWLAQQKKARTAASNAALNQIASAAMAKVETFIDQRMERIEETRESYYKFNDLLAKITVKKLNDQLKSGGSMAALDDELKALTRATKIIQVTRQERWDILNVDGVIDHDTKLPELVVRELFEKEIDRLQNSDGDDLEIELEEIDPLNGESVDPDEVISEIDDG